MVAANGVCIATEADKNFVVNFIDSAVNTTSTAPICETGTKILTGFPSGGTWSIVSGGGSIVGTTYTPPNISSNTNVTVRYTAAANGVCTSTHSDKTFIVSLIDSAVNTTDTSRICETDTKTLTGSPSGGTWSIISGGGTIVGSIYTPPTNLALNIIVTIRYTNDANGACASTYSDKTFTVNDCFKPIINSDLVVGYKGEPIGGNLSSNDFVKAGTTYRLLSIALSNPSSDIPVINADGTFSFNSNIPGVYEFTIEVCKIGQLSGCPIQVLTIIVLDPTKKSNPPIVSNDKAYTEPNTSVVVFVLNNDASGNSSIVLDKRTLTVVTQPMNGSLVVNPDGTITYSPKFGFVGFDTFYYRICDNGFPPNCANAMVIVEVIGNSKIAFVLDDLSSGFGELTGNALENDKYPIGAKPIVDAQTVVIPGKGTFTIDNKGNYIWTPLSDFKGVVQIPIRVCDGLFPARCYSSLVICISQLINDNPIPNYISPNSDGSNDIWCIDEILRVFPNTRAIIYNRWGNIVWRSNGTYGSCSTNVNVWYGQKEGSNDPVPDGVYYFMLELNDGFNTTKTGFIEVMRQ
jgi:gliding motility-associated-like protein